MTFYELDERFWAILKMTSTWPNFKVADFGDIALCSKESRAV